MSDSCTISDPYRAEIRVQRKPGGYLIRTAKLWLRLSNAEAERLAVFIRDEATLQCFPIASESTLADETAIPG